MYENFETTIPYEKVICILQEHQWDGYLLSEYEAASKNEHGYVSDQPRSHHILMKRMIGA